MHFSSDITPVMFKIFVWGFLSHSRIVHPYGDITIAGDHKRLQIFTYAAPLWPLSCYGSLACHSYMYVTRPLFIMVISEDP